MKNWHRHKKNLMSKILLYIIFFYFFIVGNLLSASEINESGNKECGWYNKIPCIQIKSNISNTSKFSEIGIKKTIISRKDIEESGAIDLIDVLNVIPNISITQSGPRGQTASLFMRGAGSNHTLVLINGVAINDQSQTQGLYDFGLDFIQTIHQVEVYQGAGGSNFGVNSIAGAINIITKADYKDSFNFSSFNKDNYDFLINKNYITDNSSTLNFKIGGVNSKTNSARYGGKEEDEINNLSGNLNFESWLNTNIKVSNSTYLRQTISEYDNSKSNEIGFEGDNKMLTSQFGLSNIKKDSEDKFIFYYNKYDREYDEQGIIDYYDSEATGIKYDRSGIFIKNLSYGIGSEYRYDWGEFINNGSYSASTKGHYDNTSIYGNLGWNFFENTNLSLFLRNDDNKITGSNETYKLNLQQKMNQLTFGMPDETRELIFDTINFVRKLPENIDATGAFIFAPYHGTPLRTLAIEKGYLKDEEICSLSNTSESMLRMPTISKDEIQGIARVFSFYIKFPKDRWDEIKIAEQPTPEGEKMFVKLGKEFDEKYRQYAAGALDLHD